MSNTKRFTNPTGKRAIFYHTSWSQYGRNFQVKDIPESVTDISYAFFNVDGSGKIYTGDSWADTDRLFTTADIGVQPLDSYNVASPFYGNFNQFKKLLDSGRKLNISLAVGGWTWSKYFSDALSTDSGRLNMISCLINVFNKYPIFNGVSLDFEYLSSDGKNYGLDGNTVRPEDPENFIAFLTALRSSLNSNGMSHYNIAMCCGAAPEKVTWPVDKITPLIDELHVMTYDFHSSSWGEKVTCHQTNPRKSSYGTWSCEEAADFYLSKGVKSSKIFIGGALYSRGFADTDGLGKSSSGTAVSDKSWEGGVVDYKVLPLGGATEYVDPESKACYSYDPIKRIFNSYDNSESIKEKCKIIADKNLGGIIMWESSGDYKDSSNPRCLSAVLKNNLTNSLVTPSPVSIVTPPVVPVSTPVVTAPVIVVPTPVVPTPIVTAPVIVVTPPVSADVILFDNTVNYLQNKYHAVVTKRQSINQLVLVPVVPVPIVPVPVVPVVPVPIVPVPVVPVVPVPTPVKNLISISFDLNTMTNTLSNVKIVKK